MTRHCPVRSLAAFSSSLFAAASQEAFPCQINGGISSLQMLHVEQEREMQASDLLCSLYQLDADHSINRIENDDFRSH